MFLLLAECFKHFNLLFILICDGPAKFFAKRIFYWETGKDISKRVSSIFDYDEIINKDLGSRYLVTINLNAPTVYYNSYLNLGSAGMYIMYFIMMMAAVFYPKILNRINNPYYLSAVASLNSILFLSMFNNMWFNIGTVLLWPIILDVFRRLRFS